jgi:flagellar protein FliJ
MKQFQFRLQKVMETTMTREELQKRELAEAFGRLRRSEEELEAMLEHLEQQIAEFTSAAEGRGAVRVSELMNYSGWTEVLAAEIRLQRTKIEKQSEDVRLQRERLLEITRDKKVLEKLKDKKYAEFKKKLRNMEQKFLDELSVRSFHNSNGIMQ